MKKFSRDVLWGMGSVGVSGLAGLALSYLIAVLHGDAALGVFNQVFAIYIFFSQLAALGIHLSVLRHVAGEERGAVLSSALALTSAIALVMAAVGLLSGGPAARILGSPDVAVGVAWASPGLVLFALNKVILAAHNGLGRLRLYAVLQAGRFVFMLAGLALPLSRAQLPALLTIGEGVVFLIAVATVVPDLGPIRRRWLAEHLRFGAKAFPSGLFSELNTRVDVLILGAFATDATVGVYSLAAILAEGMYQLLVAVRATYAPALVKGLPRADVLRGRNLTYLGALALGLLSVPGYALVIGSSWPLFAVLVGGMVAGAGYVPFGQILVCRGYPGWHTAMILAILAWNAATNAALVPPLGAIGAACATGSTFVFAALLTRRAIDFVTPRSSPSAP